MTATRLSVVTLFIAAYWDLHRVLKAMWPVAVMAFCLFVAGQFSAVFCVRWLKGPYIGVMLLKELIQLGSLVSITPFLIALHRFIQLGETTQTYEFTTAAARVARFAGWLLLLGLIASIPFLLKIVTTHAGPTYYAGSRILPSHDASVRMMVMLVAAVFLMTARLMILLPAAAADAPGAGLTNALTDTNGHVARISAAAFLCLAPLAGIFFVLVYPLQFVSRSWAAGFVVYFSLQVFTFAGIAITAALASRIYLTLGQRLRQA